MKTANERIPPQYRSMAQQYGFLPKEEGHHSPHEEESHGEEAGMHSPRPKAKRSVNTRLYARNAYDGVFKPFITHLALSAKY